jgi:hypothetical protein
VQKDSGVTFSLERFGRESDYQPAAWEVFKRILEDGVDKEVELFLRRSCYERQSERRGFNGLMEELRGLENQVYRSEQFPE